MNPQQTYNKLLQFRGALVGISGDDMTKMPEPATELMFPILAGEWPNKNFGAICLDCVTCGTSVGISPRGHAVHLINPAGRPVLCADCFILLMQIAEGSA